MILEVIEMKKLSGLAAILFAAAVAVSLSGCKGNTIYLDPVSGSGGQPAPAVSSQSAVESSVAESPATESSAEASVAQSSAEASAAESSEVQSSAAESSEVQSGAAENKTDYIYFDNSELKWEKVSAYWWNSNYDPITNKITGELYPKNGPDGTQDLKGAWPGVLLEKLGDSDIYRCAVPVGATKIIFNSGIPDDDVKNGVEAFQTGDIDFSETANAGQIYKIDKSTEATPGRAKFKTKYTYSAGAWSDYNG